jgi:hypothetical protein
MAAIEFLPDDIDLIYEFYTAKIALFGLYESFVSPYPKKSEPQV